MEEGGQTLADLETEVRAAILELEKEGDGDIKFFIFIIRKRLLQLNRNREEAIKTFREIYDHIRALKQGDRRGLDRLKQAYNEMVNTGDFIEVSVRCLSGEVEVPPVLRQSRASELYALIALHWGKPLHALLLYTPKGEPLRSMDLIEGLDTVEVYVDPYAEHWRSVADSWLNHPMVPRSVAEELLLLTRELAERTFGPQEQKQKWTDQREFHDLVNLINKEINNVYKRHRGPRRKDQATVLQYIHDLRAVAGRSKSPSEMLDLLKDPER